MQSGMFCSASECGVCKPVYLLQSLAEKLLMEALESKTQISFDRVIQNGLLRVIFQTKKSDEI